MPSTQQWFHTCWFTLNGNHSSIVKLQENQLNPPKLDICVTSQDFLLQFIWMVLVAKVITYKKNRFIFSHQNYKEYVHLEKCLIT